MSKTLRSDILRVEFRNILKHALETKNINYLETKIASYNKQTDVDLKAPLDQAFRDCILDLIEKEVEVAKLKTFIEFSIESCKKHLNSPTLPVILLGDIFETLTLDGCQMMFSFVEDNVQVWKEELFFSGCKNNLLRLCNDLLRRLSRTTATVFCGKILLFLAKFFPFSERSGLNIVSEFNLENVTEYGLDSNNDSNTVTEIVSGDQKHIIDYSFYCKFWQLQDFFRNPNQCYDKVQWKVFHSHSTNILNTFQGIKLDYVSTVDKNDTNVGYFAKYLTSQKLLDLQLHDVSFRRSVLLQFLIVFQYLTSPVKFKSDSYELKPDQKEWIQTTTEKIYTLLKETPPDGENFEKIVKNILKREELWNIWKNDGCPDMKKLMVKRESHPIEDTNSRPLLGDLIKDAQNKNQFYMGSGELTKLWNFCPNNLEACKGKERDFLPSLEEYFSEAVTQMESDTPLSDDKDLLKDSNFGWRALRLLARRSPHFFSINTQNHPLSKYLEAMVHKIAHEKPGRIDETSQESQHEPDIEENLLTEEQNTEDFKPGEQEDFTDENHPRTETKNINEETLQLIIEKVVPDWEKLGIKLGYKPDEIEWFKNEHTSRNDQAKQMMSLWFNEDEDATLDNLLYILEGLDMNEAAETVRKLINPSDGVDSV